MKILKIVAVNIIVLVILLTPLELIYGGWLVAPGMWDFAFYRNVEWKLGVADRYPSEGRITYRRDYHGLRGNYKNVKAVNILTIGGSTTDERFIDEGKTWPDRLGQCLQQRGYQAVVANAGVAGQSSVGHILNFQNWFNYIKDLKPKYIVAFVGINERGVGGEWQQKLEDVRTFTEAHGSHDVWKTIRIWLRINSAVYNLYKTIRGNAKAWQLGYAIKPNFRIADPSENDLERDRGTVITEKKFLATKTNALKIGDKNYLEKLAAARESQAKALTDYSKRLDILTSHIRNFGAEPIYVTNIWSSFRIKDNIVAGDLKTFFSQEAYHEVTRKHCETEKLHCQDVSRDMTVMPGDFFDIMHTTPKGSKKIGDLICRNFPKNGLSRIEKN
ncbi:MAG: SGNH/GDSL hydrolase family protein [Rhodospirillaceae bacterium]|nr:SGNH/GDSL hydrolase family protein [Rhodospirillaceae bacterium]MBT7953761.1 SGNH/GDSL hydrolase family protein [Rhodospirillaceae bacterium]